jgi:hypothetical protein
MDSRTAGELQDVPEEILGSYREVGINPFCHLKELSYRWDFEVADWLEEYGADVFRNLDIWDADWEVIFRSKGLSSPAPKPRRTFLERIIGTWLSKTQYRYPNFSLKVVDRLIRPLYR